MIHHLDYEIDKKKYSDMFYDNIQKHGRWHWAVPEMRDLFWYQIMIPDKHELKPLLESVERDLNIYGMNNFPRFSYQFPNSLLEHHLDEDEMVSININLFDTIPEIHLEHKPHPYQCALIDVGHVKHGVEPDINPRLILKFCLRHPYEEVYNRLNDVGLIQ
tara:strand:+ start:238 stop:720 length:483 start_codon:yes stop_codon:yes gene_type:complete